MRVAILGSGPAGLIAAHAAATDGRVDTVDIYSRGEKSTMYGAQYLHSPVPGATFDEPIMIKYILKGTFDGYREKVYGPRFTGAVSPEDLASDHKAWDIRKTYDWLWLAYSPSIKQIALMPADIEWMLTQYDLIVSSVPAKVICSTWHEFMGTQIWAAGEAPEIGHYLDIECEPNTVICSGSKDDLWYRKSNIYGRKTIEWPISDKVITGDVLGFAGPGKTGAASVTKPTSTNCTCWDGPSFLRVGRYGAWRKGALSHEAYIAVQRRLDALERSW